MYEHEMLMDLLNDEITLPDYIILGAAFLTVLGGFGITIGMIFNSSFLMGSSLALGIFVCGLLWYKGLKKWRGVKMKDHTIDLRTTEYTTVYFHRIPGEKNLTVWQDGKGNLIVNYDNKRVVDEREEVNV
jgi:hypothetical protein